jgi:hypothetical protein
VKTSTLRAELEQNEPDTVLVVHGSPRVRGAIHRSLSPFQEFSISLVPSLAEARALYSREAPSVVLLRLHEDSIAWGKELRGGAGVPIVFCYTQGDQMSLCTKARAVGMQHFVELPGDMPSSWGQQASRVSSTLQHALAHRRSREKAFARSTMVLAAAPKDLELSKTGEPAEPGRDRLVRLRRSTLVRSVAAADLDKARRGE